MSGHIRPLTCCDSECAAVNHCVKGGVQCNGCGLYFCEYNLNEIGFCEDCAAKLGSDPVYGGLACLPRLSAI